MSRILCLTASLFLVCSTDALAQTKSALGVAVGTVPTAGTLTLDRYEGGSMKVLWVAAVQLNGRSTLKREWFVVRDDAAPATLTDKTGIDVAAKQERSAENYRYVADWSTKLKEPITSISICYVVLDVFGNVMKTLRSTAVEDAGESYRHAGEWRIYSEKEASEAFTSVAFIDSVRTAAGRVYEIDRAKLLEQVKRVNKRVTEADLEPAKTDAAK